MKRIAFLLPLLMTACSMNLLEPNNGASLARPTPVYMGSQPNPWYIYDDSYNTGDWIKGVAVWDAYWYVTVEFGSTNNPYRGSSCIRINYNNANPGPVSPTWAETVFIHAPTFATFGSLPGVNISSGNYTKCKFMIRTSVNATVPVQAEGTAVTNVAATTAWKEITIGLNGPAQSATKTFFEINTPSVMPLDIFIDDLRYEK